MPRSLHLPCISALVILAALSTAHADDVTAYRDAVERGRALFAEGDYTAARASFRAAYEIHAEPVLLFNIASTYRREGDRTQAIELYRKFVTAAPDHARRDLALETIRDLEAELAAEADAVARERAEAEAEAEADAEAEAKARARAKDSAEDTKMTARLALPHRDDPPTATRGSRNGAVLRGVGVGVAALAIVPTGAALLAFRDARRAEDDVEAGLPWNTEQDAAYQRGEAANRRVLLWSATAGALVTTGIVLYIVGDRRRDRGATSVVVAPSMGGVVASGRF